MTTGTSNEEFRPVTMQEVMDDLSSRFVVNCPDEERESFDRLLFQIEAAHWFYEDFYREKHQYLPTLQLRDFTENMFKYCPVLKPYYHSWAKIYSNFTNYKIRVPVCGAILLNPTMDKCVLVKGWTSRSSWGFPKGKINKDECELNCAIREVLEETGYDLIDQICEDDYVEVTMRQQRSRLYIITNVEESTQFAPQTRKEISKIEWHRIDELPSYSSRESKNGHSGPRGGSNANNFFMVMPYVAKLKQWIVERRRRMGIRIGSSVKGHPSNGVTGGGRGHKKSKADRSSWCGGYTDLMAVGELNRWSVSAIESRNADTGLPNGGYPDIVPPDPLPSWSSQPLLLPRPPHQFLPSNQHPWPARHSMPLPDRSSDSFAGWSAPFQPALFAAPMSSAFNRAPMQIPLHPPSSLPPHVAPRAFGAQPMFPYAGSMSWGPHMKPPPMYAPQYPWSPSSTANIPANAMPLEPEPQCKSISDILAAIPLPPNCPPLPPVVRVGSPTSLFLQPASLKRPSLKLSDAAACLPLVSPVNPIPALGSIESGHGNGSRPTASTSAESEPAPSLPALPSPAPAASVPTAVPTGALSEASHPLLNFRFDVASLMQCLDMT